MKVLMISNDLAFLGAMTSTGDTIERHRAYGQFVDKLSIIVLTKKGHFKTSELAPNVLAYPTNSSHLFHYVKNILAVAKDLFSINNYDLIVCQDPFLTGLAGYCLKKKYGARLLIDFHGDFWANPYWLKENPLRLALLALSKFTVKKADALRVVSLGLKKKLLRANLNHTPIAVIPTPVQLENFKTPDSQTVMSIKNEFSGKKIILFTGRLSPEKNLPFLIRCFKKIISRYPSVVLLIIGDGQEKTKLHQLIISLKLTDSIKLLGQISYQGLLNYFHACDLFVLPSRHESFGKVLLEAAASGKPAVASATTGAKEIIINGKTGFLVPVNNGKKFANQVLSLLNDEDLAHRLGTEAYAHVWHQYDWDQSIKNVVSFWQKIVADKK
ncbi:MAG TPA: glycosyltransferase family 4 protein [Patescibacteria group bacterium]|nr:glycosyltransferase family 4 protein [Patescibacteria group bacterium]